MKTNTCFLGTRTANTQVFNDNFTMSDPLSIGASILAIIGAAARITSLVNGIADAPQSAQRAVNDVRSFQVILLALNKFLVHRRGNPEDTALGFVEARLYVDDLAYFLQESLEIMSGLKAALEEICDVNKEGDKVEVKMNGLGRGKWIMQEKDILARVQSLESHKASLNTILTLLTWYVGHLTFFFNAQSWVYICRDTHLYAQ